MGGSPKETAASLGADSNKCPKGTEGGFMRRCNQYTKGGASPPEASSEPKACSTTSTGIECRESAYPSRTKGSIKPLFASQNRRLCCSTASCTFKPESWAPRKAQLLKPGPVPTGPGARTRNLQIELHDSLLPQRICQERNRQESAEQEFCSRFLFAHERAARLSRKHDSKLVFSQKKSRSAVLYKGGESPVGNTQVIWDVKSRLGRFY